MILNQMIFELRVFKDEGEFSNKNSKKKTLQAWKLAHTKT